MLSVQGPKNTIIILNPICCTKTTFSMKMQSRRDEKNWKWIMQLYSCSVEIQLNRTCIIDWVREKKMPAMRLGSDAMYSICILLLLRISNYLLFSALFAWQVKREGFNDHEWGWEKWSSAENCCATLERRAIVDARRGKVLNFVSTR